MKTPALASLLLLSPVLALAQQEVDRAATPPTQGNQLERVSVTRQQTDTDLRRREPVAKQLYGRDELDKYGDTQLSDVLKRLPGINVSGGQLRMRGLGGAYTQILVNGEPAPPGFSLDNLNPAQVERLEVSKAPTADQSAQAIAGTLNIILKDAPRVVQKDLRLGMAYASEKPVVNAGFTYGDRIVGGLGFVLPISINQWNFVNESSGDRVRDKGLTGLRNDGRDRSFGHGFNMSPRLNWKLGDDETLSVQGFFVQNRFRSEGENTTQKVFFDPVNSVLPPSVLDTTRNRGTFQAQRLNLQYNNRFGEDRRIELRAGVGSGGADFNFEFFGRNKDGLPAIDRFTTGDNRNRNATLSAKYSQYAGEAHTITTGAELERRTRDETRSTKQIEYRDRKTDKPIEDPKLVDLLTGVEGQPFNATITRSAVYVQDEWEINNQWSAYAGVRQEQIKTASEGQGSQFDSTSKVTTPLLHLNFKPDPKGRDMVRASLTRSYKAADVQQLIARPTVNTDYEVRGPKARVNTELGPDRIGNPALKPELATGLDIAYEKYLPAGGLVSVGVFHRRITNLIRTDEPRLMTVDYADTQRWVITQINLAKATTQGLEVEVKGRAGELFPSLFDPGTALNLRASLNVYRSRVGDIPGPDNRLEGQQPWQFNFGADYRMKSLPINMGFSAQIAPEFDVRQSRVQSQTSFASRSLDAFAMMQVSKQDGVRVSVNGLFQPKQGTRVVIIDSPDYNLNRRQPVPWWAVNWEHKF
ncbi:iron complex outermembrane receptor protein [Pelomonas aquatica]|uniref:Iron complex outermembrane receptor protein n=1 Tax=Pelomonas aquatica TaxID=431058 RepID=A0ABU1Z442_9BURK|nr:TonB-dependent receptor [Pelomonas aquatica]MDR7295378.1 iron complex outermembrane receptor protein [Pelomonas aquatica]